MQSRGSGETDHILISDSIKCSMPEDIVARNNTLLATGPMVEIIPEIVLTKSLERIITNAIIVRTSGIKQMVETGITKTEEKIKIPR